MKRLFVLMLTAIALIGGTQYVKAQDGAFAVGVAGEMSRELLKGEDNILAYGGVELFANYKYEFSSRFFILPEVAIAQRWHRSNLYSDKVLTSLLDGTSWDDLRSISSVFALRPNFGVNVVKGSNWNLGLITGPEMDWIFAQSHKVRYTNEYNPYVEIARRKEKKVQWGWNVGALADINKIRLGVAYMIRIGEMMEVDPKKPGTLRISVGYRF